MKAFIHTLLGYDGHHQDLEGGALGTVQSYYGCIEAQGRGSLHCHMLIWLEGGLHPNEVKQHILEDDSFKFWLLNFMEDSISTCIPDDPDPLLSVASSTYHPCSIRGTNQGC
jgi:Helitron helicase-like domain at N-terminus